MAITPLLQPLRLGALTLPNRILMAPLTRMRAAAGGVPTAMNALYYAQRATAGLIVTEATHTSFAGQSYPNQPGIHSAAQVAGWRQVTAAVHAAGGRIVLQLVHAGRTSHTDYDAAAPVGASAKAPATGMAFTPAFELKPFETPRALQTAEVTAIVGEFRRAAANAIAAGFDGVEIHAANGYLLDQFMQDGSNQRDDVYGGSIDNRARLLLDVVDAMGAEIGLDRIGVRLSPFASFNDMHDSDPVALFGHVINQLSVRGVAYLHLIEARAASLGLSDELAAGLGNNAAIFRALFDGPVISAGGYDAASAATLVAGGGADAVAFGRMFIANPDLVARLSAGADLNQYDRATFYGGAEQGYLDYPALTEAAREAA